MVVGSLVGRFGASWGMEGMQVAGCGLGVGAVARGTDLQNDRSSPHPGSTPPAQGEGMDVGKAARMPTVSCHITKGMFWREGEGMGQLANTRGRRRDCGTTCGLTKHHCPFL